MNLTEINHVSIPNLGRFELMLIPQNKVIIPQRRGAQGYGKTVFDHGSSEGTGDF